MAKRKSSSRSISLGGVLVIGVLLVIAGVFFGWDAVAQIVSEATGIDIPVPTEEVVGQPPVDSGQVPAEVTGSTTGAFTVYFTNPVIPFDDVVTGGLDGQAVELINNATTSIDAAMFEFDLQSVADALIAAHNRGVRVRIVYDDEHTEDDPQIEQLIDAGIPAVPDERSAFMHNKFYVFDGSIVWTGSMNFTENGAYRNNNNVMIIRSSQLAQNYTTEFEEMFNRGEFGTTSTANTPNPIFTLDGVRIENYFASEDEVMPALVAAVNGAQTSIHFMIFSFTEDSLGDAIIARGQAGVEVAGIFETRGANTEYSECPRLQAQGFDVRLDTNPRTFHHKVIIIDGSIVATGSFNFSDNATSANDENLVIIHSPDVAAQYEAEFNRRMAESEVPISGDCLGPDDD